MASFLSGGKHHIIKSRAISETVACCTSDWSLSRASYTPWENNSGDEKPAYEGFSDLSECVYGRRSVFNTPALACLPAYQLKKVNYLVHLFALIPGGRAQDAAPVQVHIR